jgi:DMSO/TMAO reductase YedYZ molybdopterin-dependent catalytic subunit
MRVGRLAFEGDRARLVDTLPINLAALQQLPKVPQITELRCVEGWSAIAKWGGVRCSVCLRGFQPRPEERFLFFYAADRYYDVLDMATLHHPQSLPGYEMNDQPLPLEHGGPVRLIAPTKIGYKNAKWIVALGLTTTNPGGFWDRRGYPWFYCL